ncbi:MAG: hypothetical protein ABI970_04180, partial [Chloroflexota bacterium]
HRRWFTALSLALLTLVVLFSALTPQVRADSIYSIPDQLDYATTHYAITVNNGKPILTYQSKNTNTLVVAFCGNPACETALTDIRGIVGSAVRAEAITIVNGNPFIAYSTLESPSISHLKVIACVDPTCSQPAVYTPLDTGDFLNMSITLQNGKPLIAYENLDPTTAHHTVKLAFCSDATCTAATIRSLDVTDGIQGNYGMGVGLLNSNPIVVFTTGSVVNLLKCLSATCAETPTVITVETNPTNLHGIALTVAAITPIITYLSRENSILWLKAATCTDSACAGPLYIHTVGEAFDYGLGTTSVTLLNGLPVIAYENQGIRLATCLDIPCNYSSSIQIVQRNNHLPLIGDSNGYPVVASLQDTRTNNRMPQIYFGGDFNSVQSPTPSETLTGTVRPTASFTPPSTPPTATFTITPSITPTPSNTPIPSFTPTDTPLGTSTPTPVTPTSAANAAPLRNFYTISTPTLTWNRISWATGYVIFISTDINFAPAATLTKFLPSSSLTFTTEPLSNGIYYWRVKAVGNTSDVFTWSHIDSFVIATP